MPHALTTQFESDGLSAIAPTTPESSLLSIPEIITRSAQMGVCFIGGCGGNSAYTSLASTAPDTSPHLKVAVCNTDGPALNKLFGKVPTGYAFEGEEVLTDTQRENLRQWARERCTNEHLDGRFLLLQLGESGAGAGCDPNEGARLARARMPLLFDFFEDVDFVLLKAGFGKGTGSGATPVIAEALREAGKTVIAVVVLPDEYEGEVRTERAGRALQEMYRICPTVAIYNSLIPEEHLDLEEKEAFMYINETCLLPVFRVFHSRILEVGLVNTDLNDADHLFKAGSYVQIGFYDLAPGEVLTKEVVRKHLLAAPYQNGQILKAATRVDIQLHGPSSVRDRRLTSEIVTEVIHEYRASQGAKEKVEIIYGSYPEGSKRWISLIAVAKELPRSASRTSIEEEAVSFPSTDIAVSLEEQDKKVLFEEDLDCVSSTPSSEESPLVSVETSNKGESAPSAVPETVSVTATRKVSHELAPSSFDGMTSIRVPINGRLVSHRVPLRLAEQWNECRQGQGSLSKEAILARIQEYDTIGRVPQPGDELPTVQKTRLKDRRGFHLFKRIVLGTSD